MPDQEVPAQCFVIMPISDIEPYPAGHFKRVYSHALQPAIRAANCEPVRADDIATTNYIIVDIVDRIIKAPIAVCDLSARNPNVLFELGIRQAFDLPVVLVKDSKTDRVFDIQGLRTVEYDESLRVDEVEDFKRRLTAAIVETRNAPENSINSLIRLLGVQKAQLGELPQLSSETSIVLNALRDVNGRLDQIDKVLSGTTLQAETLRYISARPSARNTRLQLAVPLTFLEGLEKLHPNKSKAEIIRQALAKSLLEDLAPLAPEAFDPDADQVAVRLSVDVDEELFEALIARSSKMGISIASVARRALARATAP